MRRRVITDGDVAEALGVVDAVDVGAAVGIDETGVCVVVGAVSGVIAGDAVAGDAAADGVTDGFAAVGNTEGDGDALPRVGVAVGGALVCDTVGFGVVGVAMCAVTDGCADAPLGTSVAGGAAAAWDVMPAPSAALAIRRDATARRKPAEERYRRMFVASFFSCKTVTSVLIAITKNAFTPILTRITGITLRHEQRSVYRMFKKCSYMSVSGACVDVSNLALDLGYFDQAHFINDFKAIVGSAPADYAKKSGSAF